MADPILSYDDEVSEQKFMHAYFSYEFNEFVQNFLYVISDTFT